MINRFAFDVMPAATRRAMRRVSLAEIMFAGALVGGAWLAMGRTSDTLPDGLTVSEQRVMAAELAAERLHAARVAGAHADTMATLESSIPGYPGFTRVTAVRRIRGDAGGGASYRMVTTAVLVAGLPTPERKMALIRVE